MLTSTAFVCTLGMHLLFNNINGILGPFGYMQVSTGHRTDLIVRCDLDIICDLFSDIVHGNTTKSATDMTMHE